MKRITFVSVIVLITYVCLISSLQAQPREIDRSDNKAEKDIFDRENLVAWCIVPFDGKQRGPAQRAEMLKRLELRRVAYDWRQNHVPTFEDEILEYKKHGLEYFAFWGTHPEALRLFEKYKLHPQIWQTLGSPPGETQEEWVTAAAKQILPLVEVTRKMGCKLGLYNHGGWGGEPENLVAVCRYLRQHHGGDHVGIVYNLHHAHSRIDDFAKVVAMLKPYLLCLNLNGTTHDGERVGKKILPLGEGELDVKLLKIIRDSGYDGPIGIIGHTQDDVEKRLLDNLDGLDWILPQLDGKPAGTKPILRTWSPEKKQPPTNSVGISGAILDGRDEFRAPPLTVECRVTLSDRHNYNILVASDSKASGAHWEIFSMRGSGMFTTYLPGMKPDHVLSKAMICDGQPHTVSMLYEPNRVRLVVDSQVVADQPVESAGRKTVPGGLGIGRLVQQQLGCSGPIHWVRISQGIRQVPEDPVIDAENDDTTILLWRPKNSPRPLGEKNASVQSETTPPPYSADFVATVVESARREGNAQRGLMVFSSAKSACLSCHKVGRHGGDVGPDLTEIAKQRKPEEIIESVIWPKRRVEPKFVARMILTDDGHSHRGYVVNRDEQQVVLRDPTKPGSADIQISADQIEDEREVGTLMPDNLLASMSDNQVHDLFRFLLGLGRDDGVPPQQLDLLLEHAHAHANGPATFPYDRKPLRPECWPSWQQNVNRDRLYDFYAKQADYFRAQHHSPPLLAEYPGLDGGTLGHWGNQNEKTWASDRWNDTILGSLQCGVFRGAGLTVPRGVCLRLGDKGEVSACFNPDTLTYDAVWTGGFLKFSSVRHGFMHGVLMNGTALPRPAGKKPDKPFQYLGFYRQGKRVVFSYRIGGVEYLDAPWVKDGRFTREVAPADKHSLRGLLTDPPQARPQQFETPIEFGGASPYAVDTIGLPTENPWKAQIFVGGLSFLPDGSALVCTMHGDVWHVEGFEYPSKTARWKRFASGLHHLLGMVIDKDGIFVLGRDQITRLHDANNDGQADFYECFSNAYETSPAGHDFICGLQRDRVGSFFTASGNQGVVRISADGKKADVVATGFRNPDGLGILPDGTITVPCSEGSWTPASMICAVRPTELVSFHGAGGPRQGRAPELPLVYLPRGVDNSSGGQTVVTSDRWGPLKDQILHFSFGTGTHHLVLRDEVDGQLQGAVVPLLGEFRSGAHRGRFSPSDGQLYVGGMQGWGTYTTDDGCFQRVRYTGDNVQLPVGFHVHENGILLRFSSPLDIDTATSETNHFAQCWNYRYSGAYGSPEFSAKHHGMRGHDVLAITSAHVLEDGTAVFLEIPELQPVNQLHLLVRSSPKTDHQLFVTVHKLEKPFTDFPGYRPTRKTIDPHPIVADLAMATRSTPNPHRKTIKNARKITIKTGTNLSYQTRSFQVRAGEPIQFTLANPDVVPHNWALAKPGTMQRVGRMANQLISDPEAVIRHYIPQSSDVIAYTDIVLPREEFTIFFHAPKEPGRYPYLCTFPGHWLIMNGEMIVTAD